MEMLYHQYKRRVFGMAHRIVGVSDAEEVAQEVFVRVYRGLAAFRGDSALSTWVYRLTVNAALSHLAGWRGRRHEAAGDDGLNELPAPPATERDFGARDAWIETRARPVARRATARSSCTTMSRGCRTKNARRSSSAGSAPVNHSSTRPGPGCASCSARASRRAPATPTRSPRVFASQTHRNRSFAPHRTRRQTTMTTCETIQPRLTAYLDGELDGERRAASRARPSARVRGLPPGRARRGGAARWSAARLPPRVDPPASTVGRRAGAARRGRGRRRAQAALAARASRGAHAVVVALGAVHAAASPLGGMVAAAAVRGRAVVARRTARDDATWPRVTAPIAIAAVRGVAPSRRLRPRSIRRLPRAIARRRHRRLAAEPARTTAQLRSGGRGADDSYADEARRALGRRPDQAAFDAQISDLLQHRDRQAPTPGRAANSARGALADPLPAGRDRARRRDAREWRRAVTVPMRAMLRDARRPARWPQAPAPPPPIRRADRLRIARPLSSTGPPSRPRTPGVTVAATRGCRSSPCRPSVPPRLADRGTRSATSRSRATTAPRSEIESPQVRARRRRARSPAHLAGAQPRRHGVDQDHGRWRQGSPPGRVRGAVRIDLARLRAPRDARVEAAVVERRARGLATMDAGSDLDTASGPISVRNVQGEVLTRSVFGLTRLAQANSAWSAPRTLSSDLDLGPYDRRRSADRLGPPRPDRRAAGSARATSS